MPADTRFRLVQRIAAAGSCLAIGAPALASEGPSKPQPIGADADRGFRDCDGNGLDDNVDHAADFADIPYLGLIGTADRSYNFNSCGSDFDTVMAVFDGSGAIIATNDDACGLQSNIDMVLPAGDYFVGIAGFPAVFLDGPFVSLPFQCPDEGTALFNIDGLFASPFFLASGRVDIYRFTVGDDCDGDSVPDQDERDCDGNGTPDECEIPTPADAIDLGTFTAAVPGSQLPDQFTTCASDFDTRMAVFDPFGTLVAEGDNECGLQSVISTFFSPGEHIIAVGGAGVRFDHGFNITLEDSAGCTAGGNLVLDGPVSFSGFLGSNRVALLRVNAVLSDCDGDGTPDSQELDCDQNGIPDDCEVPASNEALDLGSFGSFGGSVSIVTCFNTDFHTDLALFDSAGNLIAEDDQSCDLRSRILEQLPDGEYFLALGGSDTTFADNLAIIPNAQGCSPGGAYEIRINTNDTFQIAGDLPPGRVLLFRFSLFADCNADGIPDADDLDCDNDGVPDNCQIPSPQAAEDFGVIGDSSGVIDINTTGSDFDTEIAVFDSFGQLVAVNDDSNSTLQSQLLLTLAPGTYYVSFSGFNTIFSDGFGILLAGCTDAGNLMMDLNGVTDSGPLASGRVRLAQFTIVEPPSCPADLAEPFGTLNFFDLAAYLALLNANDPAADLAAPFGALNFFDLAAYLDLYNAGCP